MNMLRYANLPARIHVDPLDDGALVTVMRRLRSGASKAGDSLRIGPNIVHAAVLHEDGSITDCGFSHNLFTTATNGGRDIAAAGLGGVLGFGVSATIATNSSGTTLTGTSTPFVASAYIGQIVIAEESTNAPVWGVIISNTTSVLTIDGWKNGDGSAGTTPGTTANFQILPGTAPIRYMALTTDAGAADATHTSLASEATTGNCGRALATYAHSLGAATFTLTKTFTPSAGFTFHRIGLFQVSTASSALLAIESVLNADAIVVSGDSLAITDTVTLS